MKSATLKSYSVGLVASVGLTLAAYFLVVNQVLSGRQLTHVILAMAVAQLVVQMVYFLGAESRDRWNLSTFLLTLGLVLIVVVGSLWIMDHLNVAMSGSQPKMMEYIDSQQGF